MKDLSATGSSRMPDAGKETAFSRALRSAATPERDGRMSTDSATQHLKLPDLWQQEAVTALQKGQDVIVQAPTGAGKTYIFELFRQKGLKGQAVYTVPTRALANDKLSEWRARGWDVGISTGDLAENLNAQVVVATLETQKGRLLEQRGPSLLVVDEYQLLADPVRGVNYELALALAPPSTQLLLLSGSVGNPQDVVDWLKRLGRDATLVSTKKRPVPLEEVVVEALPYRVPKSVRGYWTRAMTAALMADLGPILLFAPQRKACEKLAKQLASGLPSPAQPLELTQEQQRLCGGELTAMLKNRVAYHHSGLSYAVRAGVIEPLARAGQLRTVVATMGLAAGINFSTRSVVVTDSCYMHRDFEHRVRPDELLQMFGRAGRRGLDEIGYVLVMPDRPRMFDAHEARLARPAQLDWPSLLAMMHAARQRGDNPFEAASRLNGSLFSKQVPPLGVEVSLKKGPFPCALTIDAERARLSRTEKHMLGSRDQWEALPNPATVRLSDAWMRSQDRWKPALCLPEIVSKLEPRSITRLCKIKEGRNRWRYGKQAPLASLIAEGDKVRLSKWLFQALCQDEAHLKSLGKNLPAGRIWPRKLFEEAMVPHLSNFIQPGRVHATAWQGSQFFVTVDCGHQTVKAYKDQRGRWLVNPPRKDERPETCRNCPEFEACHRSSTAQSPALAWRELGLIDRHGHPTRRGVIFSFFNKGEGLAISAALEDKHYHLEDLIFDLANLRAGHRFCGDDSHYGGRIGVLCQEAFERQTIPGYLELGVPIQYGDGAGEIMRELVEGEKSSRGKGGHGHLNELLRPGDIERAMMEWQSLLRQIQFAPDYGWDRWMELKGRAKELVEWLDAQTRTRDRLVYPALTAEQKRTRMSHRLTVPGR